MPSISETLIMPTRLILIFMIAVPIPILILGWVHKLTSWLVCAWKDDKKFLTNKLASASGHAFSPIYTVVLLLVCLEMIFLPLFGNVSALSQYLLIIYSLSLPKIISGTIKIVNKSSKLEAKERAEIVKEIKNDAESIFDFSTLGVIVALFPIMSLDYWDIQLDLIPKLVVVTIVSNLIVLFLILLLHMKRGRTQKLGAPC